MLHFFPFKHVMSKWTKRVISDRLYLRDSNSAKVVQTLTDLIYPFAQDALQTFLSRTVRSFTIFGIIIMVREIN